MNLFYLSSNPERCARYHCDKHMRMISEYCQLLSVAVWAHDPKQAKRLHKRGHIYCAPNAKGGHSHYNHPTQRWVRESKQHFQYLYLLCEALGEEDYYRYGYKRDDGQGRYHECILKVLRHIDYDTPVPDNGWKPPPKVMGLAHREGSTITAYRRFYQNSKIRFAKYTRRKPPIWMQEVLRLKEAERAKAKRLKQ